VPSLLSIIAKINLFNITHHQTPLTHSSPIYLHTIKCPAQQISAISSHSLPASVALDCFKPLDAVTLYSYSVLIIVTDRRSARALLPAAGGGGLTNAKVVKDTEV